MIKVIADTREKIGRYHFSNNEGFSVSVEKVDTGDYTIQGLEDKVMIERKKSVSELATNINEDRFWRELERAKVIPHRFIICEFDYDDIDGFPGNMKVKKEIIERIKIRPPFIYKKILEIQVDYGIHVLLCGNAYCAESMVEKIIKRIYAKYS
jgi:ERCC4-type nuclease